MHYLPKASKRPKKVRPVRDYVRFILYSVILPVVLIFAIINVVFSIGQHQRIAEAVFSALEKRIELLIRESIRGIKSATIHADEDILKALESTYKEVDKKVESGYTYDQIDFETILGKVKKWFHSEIFKDVNWYILSKNGVIIKTDYEPDLGLELYKFRDFWNSLQVNLKKGPVIHKVGFEVVTGQMRIFAYKRLSNGDIWELGFLVNNDPLIENLSKLKGLSIFIEKVGVYNVAYHPLLPEYPPFPKKTLKFHPFKRDLIGEIEIEGFSSYKEKLYIYSRLNFFSVFKIVLFNTVTLMILFLSLVLVAHHLEIWASKEIGVLKKGLLAFREGDSEALNPDVSNVEEVRENFVVLKEAIEVIEEEKREINNLLKELREAFFDFSERLAMVAEGYDMETGEHIRRVKAITKMIVEKLNIPENLKEEIVNYSVLHDVGKIYIPLSILNKPGPLDAEEWELMKQHTIFAQRLLAHPRFKTALDIALYHHENYDGTGYPFGLAGEAIPLPGRILKIVDVYDALRSVRPYKKAYSKEEAIKIMTEGNVRTRPEHFDPKLLEIFIEEILKEEKDLYLEM